MYKEIVRPVLDHSDSETWHIQAQDALHFAEASLFTLKILEKFADRGKRFTDKRLNVVLGGKVNLDNPLMVGAG